MINPERNSGQEDFTNSTGEAGSELPGTPTGGHGGREVQSPERQREYPPGFNERRVKILNLVAQGYTAEKEIPDMAELTSASVRNDLQHIFERLGVNSSTQAVIAGFELGIIDPNQIVSGLNVAAFDSLDTNSSLLLEAMTTYIGRPTNKNLAEVTPFKSANTVKDALGKLQQSTGTRNRYHLVSAYAAHTILKKRQEPPPKPPRA